MKRFITVLLICCMLLPLYGCSSEPVPYSDRLMSGRACYMDVTEIIPIGGTTWDILYLYCQCVLADGSTAFMRMDTEDYITYFHSGVDKHNLSEEALKIVFDEPVRLMGTAETDEVDLDPYSDKEKKVRLFFFESSDTAKTLNKGTRSYPNVEYSEGMKESVPVYVEILELKYEKPIFNYGVTFVSDYLCKAITPNGEELWVIIDESDYEEYFANGSLFATPGRILGETALAEDQIENSEVLSLLPDMIISFYGVDKNQFESCKLVNQPPIPLEEAETLTQPVYADFAELIPVGTQGGYGQVYYKGVLTDGSTVWMKVDEKEYRQYFNPEDDDLNLDYAIRMVTYERPVRMIGLLEQDDVMPDDRSEEKTTVRLFHFQKFDFGQSLVPSVKEGYGQPFDEEMRKDILVYADILAFSCSYKVTWWGLDDSHVSSYIGKANTAEGKDLWILISKEDYKAFFGTETEFIEPARIFGLTAVTEEEIRNPEEVPEIPSLLFAFNGVVSSEFESLKASSQPREEYTGDHKISQKVYADIVEIKAEYTVTVQLEYIETEEYVCSCKNTDGRKIWIYMSGHEMLDHFSPKFDSEKVFTEPVRINGQVYLAESKAQGLKDAIGQETIIVMDDK